MIVSLIIGCEIAFWLFVAAGLAARYLLRRKTLGAALLLCTPLVDLVLLVAAVLHVKSGATADMTHGIAAVYIGVSVAYGHRMIRWADVRFAHRFAGGPAPVKPPKGGPEHARNERIGWFMHLLAWVIGCAILLGMIAIANAPERTEALQQMIRIWSSVLGIDFLISFSYTLWPRAPK